VKENQLFGCRQADGGVSIWTSCCAPAEAPGSGFRSLERGAIAVHLQPVQRSENRREPPRTRRFCSRVTGKPEVIRSAVGLVSIATHACHLVSQKSIDSAPLPLRAMTRRSDRSNTKYSIPSPLFDPNQFSVHPSGKWTERTGEGDEQSTGRDSP
jgi:hypothetical protein